MIKNKILSLLLLVSSASFANDMLDAADIKKGKLLLVGCLGCHSTKEYEPKNSKRKFVGPTLFGVYNRQIASVKSQKYSKGLLKLKAQKWTVSNLSKWLKAPDKFAPGNSMNITGVLDPQDRYDMIAYIMTLK